MPVKLKDLPGLFRHALFGARRGRMLNPGDPAPAFSCPDQSGKTRTLRDFQGKTLVLWFYPKADTPG